MLQKVSKTAFILYLLSLGLLFPGLLHADEEYWEYTFRPGDNIWNIAEKYTTSVNNWSEIQRINEIRQGKDRVIRPGTRIVIPIAMLKQQPVPAIVIAIHGDVSLVRSDGKTSQVEQGTKIFNGDKLITADKQSIRLRFADRSELLINKNSEVVMDKLSHHKQTGMVDTKVRLNSGSVNTRVKKQKSESNYEIRTPAAITAVRGTEFRLSADDKLMSRTEVTEGNVDVSTGDSEKSVKQGYGIVAEKDKPLPEPVRLLPAPEITVDQVDKKLSARLQSSIIDGAKSYRYQVSTDKDFNTVIFDKADTSTSIESDDLPVGNYFLRIRGIDKYGLEGVDSTTEFKIDELPEDTSTFWFMVFSATLLIMLL